MTKKLIIFLLLSIYLLCGCTVTKTGDVKTQIEEAIINKNFTSAIKLSDRAIQENPDDQELHYLRGQALRSVLFDDGADIHKANLRLARQASSAFERVIEINPQYTGKTFVVGPYTKIQSIWGSMATTYTVKNRLDSAKWAFETGHSSGAFYPAIVEYNRNIMASCEKNAILFTNGDNDTYPMWYLQLIETYRPDITVVNLSLLNVDWYIRQLRDSYPYGINDLSCISKVQLDKVKAQRWESSEIELPTHPETGKTVSWPVIPTIEGKMIRTQDLMVIEILQRNNWQRPVYFSTTVYLANKIGIDDYLRFEGLVLRVVPEKNASSVSILHKNIMEQYTYTAMTDNHLDYIDEVRHLYRNYRISFEHLSDLYSKQGDKKAKEGVLDFMNRINLPDV